MKKDLDSTHVFQNGTGQQLIDSIEDVAKRLSTIAIVKSADIDLTNYEHIQKIVQLGMAKDYFEIGDQIPCTFNFYLDGEATLFDMPWDVVDFGPCEDPDGNVHENAMWLQSHYSLAYLQFDNYEAFYVAPEEMPAGTYCFRNGNQYGRNYPTGTFFQFTLTQPVPANGQICITGSDVLTPFPYTKTVDNWRIRTFENGMQTNPIEISNITLGADGTYLGVIVSYNIDNETGINMYNRITGGCGRWSLSAMRQWLNSDKDDSDWWEPKTKFKRIPSHINGRHGFISSLPESFAKIVKKVNVQTIKASGGFDTTYDRFFLPSSKQEYTDIRYEEEKEKPFDYWVMRLGSIHQYLSEKKAEHIRYIIGNHAAATQYVPFRTPGRTSSQSSVSFINSVGQASTTVAFNAMSPCPVCVIY